jgi:hypothetical protein
MSLKNPVTPPEIDPGTVRLVAQRLNHYAIPGPIFLCYNIKFQSSKPLLFFSKPLHTVANIGLLITITTILVIRNCTGLIAIYPLNPLFL